MEYDKEFEEYISGIPMSDPMRRNMQRAWQAARKDHYRIGEEVQNILTGERAEVKAVLSFTDSITYINPTNVRRIPAKSRIDEIAEEAWGNMRVAFDRKKETVDIIKSAILQARKEWEAER